MKRLLAPTLAAGLLLCSSPALAYSEAACMTAAGTFTATLSSLLPNWNPASNRILVWAGGGDGTANTSSGQAGGAGGAGSFNSVSGAALSSSFTYVVGAKGGNSWVCSGTANCTTFSAGGVIASAKPGASAAAGGASAGSGGNITSTIGATPLAGGTGGTGGLSKGGGGGGGSGGPNGAGVNGSAGAATNVFGAGATGDNGSGGAGGASVGAAGATGAELGPCTRGDTASGLIGPGGGGAGGNNVSLNGGAGGYGAGGGGAYFGGTPGSGGQGLVIFQWDPVNTSAFHGLLLLGVGK